ncbi:MAG: hypothetical protein J1F16_04220 [Muribaculaceae bacterium]|nr:hypothetical protein [Muribaculaceae bacterium]
MKGESDVKINYWAAHLTTIVSVTLVLLLVGIITFITLSSRKESQNIRERLEVNLVMKDSVSDTYANSVSRIVAEMPFAIDARAIGKDQALADWKEETGEDLESLFGVNPLSPEVTFRVKAQYSSPDSLKAVEHRLNAIPGVDQVVLPDSEMVNIMNSNIQGLTVILAIVAFIMIVISFVLINNTVHLTIYARRFTIHTMQLVGATNSFIRRPFILNNLLAGVMAGIISSAILAISLGAAPHLGWNDVAHYISWWLYACIAGGMIVAGPLICCLAAAVSTSRYLRQDYDELIKG